ncbi:hypothetical protein KFL_000350160 [Klebsormidium nitens]|uniref:PsbP C-terminal domain-containing protein n=1 Tax=Klebsormidium nitens TaxID=105231 RepID=A0A1Y1HM17_KLENI|nr:hypothetical protein KFL_000350160 [Klebsormidium nitens]|eukprot:GAQ79660.1 hypothetical protein KFL_000350160 [Klebsormidium nitens]
MATSMALDLAQSASNHACWVPGEFRGPQSLLQRPYLAPCWRSLERHCVLQWTPIAAANARDFAHGFKRRQALIFEVSREGGVRAETRVRAANFDSSLQGREREPTSGADEAVTCSRVDENLEGDLHGTPAGSSSQDSVTYSRRKLGLLAIPLVLIAAEARAEEADGQSAPPLASSQESSSIADSKASESPQTKDELLDGDNIKVSGGTSKTGRLEVGPDFRRYRAEDFSIYVPRSYENVTEVDDNPRSTLTMEQKAANRPYAARFASADQAEVITVVIRDASTLRLSFLQTKDISDLGSLDKAAQLLLPPGAKILKSRVVTQEVDRGQELEKVVKSLPVDIDTKLKRNYYQYEFYARGQQVALAAAAQNGKIYVVGATVPTKRWKDLAKQMRTIANSFELR